MKYLLRTLVAVLFCAHFSAPPLAQQSTASPPPDVSQLLSAVRNKAKSLESNSAMRNGFASFVAGRKLPPSAIKYSDYVLIHLLFEATRDAGFWNMHWSITDKPPNSDEVWRQWKRIARPSYTEMTATAECDELSALFAFFAERSGVKSVGLFWPYPNHTVAVWTPRLSTGSPIRVVIPTSQIFLTENDTFDTRGFDPWRQKTIYEYTRRDVPDSFELPKSLFEYFLAQLDKYAGASESALQQIRNLRDAVFNRTLSPDQAANEALRRSAAYSSSSEDRSAFQHFAEDLRSSSKH
jgi:hypothetical protein